MRYCKKCLYPENAKPTIIFDENGVCSGCNYIDSRKNLEIDWSERQDILVKITEKAKFEAKSAVTHTIVLFLLVVERTHTFSKYGF